MRRCSKSSTDHTGVFIVAAGAGERAAWFRNIQRHPDVLVTVKTRQFPARATRLGHAEAAAIILTYARAHPLAFGVVTRLVTGGGFRREPPLASVSPTSSRSSR